MHTEQIQSTDPEQQYRSQPVLQAEQAQVSAQASDLLIARIHKHARRKVIARGTTQACGWSFAANLVAAVVIYGLTSFANGTLLPVRFDPADFQHFMMGVSGHEHPTLIFGGGFAITSLLVLTAWAAARLALRGQQTATRRLQGSADLRAAGPLALALSEADPTFRAEIVETLVPLLHRLQTHDWVLLGHHERAALLEVLPTADEEFALAILGAFKQVGVQLDLELLRVFVDESQPGEVRRAAEACMAAIAARADTEQERGRLLRAADTPSATLLRPAAAGDAPDVATLLRSTETPS